MSGLLFDRQRTAAVDLVHLIEGRRRDETAWRSHYNHAEEEAQRQADETLQRLTAERFRQTA